MKIITHNAAEDPKSPLRCQASHRCRVMYPCRSPADALIVRPRLIDTELPPRGGFNRGRQRRVITSVSTWRCSQGGGHWNVELKILLGDAFAQDDRCNSKVVGKRFKTKKQVAVSPMRFLQRAEQSERKLVSGDLKLRTAAASLGFQLPNLAHPSCHLPMDSFLNLSLNFIGLQNQSASLSVLQAALKTHRRRRVVNDGCR